MCRYRGHKYAMPTYALIVDTISYTVPRCARCGHSKVFFFLKGYLPGKFVRNYMDYVMGFYPGLEKHFIDLDNQDY